MSWNDLSIREKADIIRDYVRKGTTSIMDIRNDYNSFAEGGSMDVDNSSVAQPEEQKKLTPPDWALRYMKKDGGEFEPMAYPEVLPEVEVRPTQKDYDYLRWAKKIIPDNQRNSDEVINRRIALFDGISNYYNSDRDKNPDDAIDRFQSAFALAGNPTISDWSIIGPISKILRGSQDAVSNYTPVTNTINAHDPDYMQDIKNSATRRSFMSSEFLDHVLAELSHAIQYQAEPIHIGSSNFLNRINGNEAEEYATPGKMEYNAHEIIEPWMRNFLEGYHKTNDINDSIGELQNMYNSIAR